MSGFSITLSAMPEERDRLIAELWEAGTTGITEEEFWLRAFFDDAIDPHILLSRFSGYYPRLEREDDYDWVQHSRSLWKSFPVGERFYLVPDWLDDPAPCGRVRLRIRPGLACGSGAHPCTQLCLRAIERMVAENMSVLDVGTGSGILAEAALLLGADPVFGCDIDHEATAIARSNLESMPVTPALFTGSLRSVRDDAVDLTFANLNAATLATMSRDLWRITRSHLIISGFRESEAEQVAARLKRTPKNHLEQDDWTCLIF